MNFSLKPIYILYLSVVASLLIGCSDNKRTPEEVRAETEQAENFGKEQAKRLADSSQMDSIQIVETLIDIRSRETEIRGLGEDELADTYIKAFLTELKAINPQLYEDITAKE